MTSPAIQYRTVLSYENFKSPFNMASVLYQRFCIVNKFMRNINDYNDDLKLLFSR